MSGFWLPWVLALDWPEQAKLALVMREPDAGGRPAITALVRWMRLLCCRHHKGSAFFAGEDYQPTPDDLIHAFRELHGANRYAPAVRDALRTISIHAPAPTDRAFALRYLTPLIAWMEDSHTEEPV